MADTSLVDEFKYPIKDCDSESCLQAHKSADGGTFPIGKKNRSWHTGLHFATEKPIVAIADGEVVAYRFSQKTLEAKLQSVLYSDSFVLLRHYYKSTFGNVLDFYSLYMHLDPVPAGQFLPGFLAFKGNVAKGKEFPAPGLMMYKSDDYNESLLLVPKYSYVSLTGDPVHADGASYQPISVTTLDGVNWPGVFKNAASYIKSIDNGKAYIEKAPHTHAYGASNKVWNCCKNLKGIRIRSEAKSNADIIGFIPNGQPIEFEVITGNPQWAKLKSPLPDCFKNENCFIKIHGQVAIETTGKPDQNLLGTLQIPENNKRPQIQTGDVLGGPGPFIHPSDKKIVHVEIFTLQDLNVGDGILGDTKGERYFSSIARYVIPSGQPLAPLPLDIVSLSVNDTAKIIEEPAGSQFVKIQVTGIFRTVKYSWIDDPNHKILCDELNTNTFYYKPKQKYLDDFKKTFNGWIEQTSILYRVSTTANKRRVFFPCSSISAAQVWISKSALGEKDDVGNVKITQETKLLYLQNPDSFAGQVSNQEITIDNPEVIILNDKRYIRKDTATLVEITGIEPQTPFNWGGFELLCEDPPNYDAFMDFAKVTSKFIAGKDDIKETETGKELEAAIKIDADKYDISKISDDASWKERLQKLIVRVPSEWHYSDEKYGSLSEKVGNLDTDEIKNFIKSLAFWDDCKAKGVFDETADAPPFHANAKDGKEIWCFHPIAFVQQMTALLIAGLPPNQKLNFDTFMGLIRAAADEQYTNGECCKAIAASLSYRLKKHEWTDAYDFHSLAERHKLKVIPPTDEEFAAMIEHVSHIFLDKKWSGLPEGYVLFHISSQALSSMPWDSSVLDIASAKTIGGFTFYKYKTGARSFATKLSIKDIRLVGGGDKGESLQCQADGVVSVSSDGAAKPYRYDVRVKPEWEFEFTFNIENGTTEMEQLKPLIKWELRYFTKNESNVEEVKKALTRTGNRFKVSIGAEVTDYSVRLQPLDNNNNVLCSEFTIAIKKKEQMAFNGTVLKWLDENGDTVPFQDGIRLISEIPAYSGNTDKRSKEFTGALNAGPIPEGIWWVNKNNVENSLSIGLGQIVGSQWQGSDARWGKHRVLLEPDNTTNYKGRERLSICGGNLENGGGDIHLKDLCTVFINNFTSRVMDGGRVMLYVDYASKKNRILGRLSSQYETGGRGSITVSSGAGDAGGVSYGAYQMTSKPNGGNVTLFVQSSDFPWKSDFVGLVAGTTEFSNKWKEIVTANKDKFVKIEHEYIQLTHYDPLIENVKRDNNIDITEHSDTLNDVVWSTAVQHGKNTNVINKALKKVSIPISRSKNFDQELIKQIYEERGRKTERGTLAHFPGCSATVQEGVSKRYESELAKALKELENENY
ncbi:MAG: hypothetical protein GX639_07550 [Fibrobacter sp.]|nr:hypothetical protein [Fibrobacter sp.]